MIIYTCPQCGGDLRAVQLTCNPPINQLVCHQCGWQYEEPREDMIRIPFPIGANNIAYHIGGWTIEDIARQKGGNDADTV